MSRIASPRTESSIIAANQSPLVSIITVNYNQEEVTCELLNSIKELSYPSIEVIVVDNGSGKLPNELIVDTYPTAIIINSKENLGFAGGNNLGIKVSKGEFLFFVNNDTELTTNVIENLIETFEYQENIGVVSPKIYYHENPDIIQYAGYTQINPYTARNSTVGQFEKDEGQHNIAGSTPYAHGAAMMMKREVIEKVGLMPEFFFLYYEELDWCEQIKKAGYQIYYQPKAVVYHKESISVGKLSALKTYYLTRNRILFMRRNAKSINLMIFTVFLIFFTIPKNLIAYLLKFEITHAISFTKGILWNLKNKKAHPEILQIVSVV